RATASRGRRPARRDASRPGHSPRGDPGRRAHTRGRRQPRGGARGHRPVPRRVRAAVAGPARRRRARARVRPGGRRPRRRRREGGRGAGTRAHAGGAARVARADLKAAVARDLARRIPERVVRWVFLALFAAFLWIFVLYPMLQVLWRSLLDNDGRVVGLANYLRYVRTPAIAASITNSLVVSAAAMVLTVVLAFVYAYALTRVRLPGRAVFRVAAMLPLFAPSLVHGFALVYLFGNNGIVTRQTGLNVGIYGVKGIVLAEVLYCFPHAVLILTAALAAADARL